MSLVIVTLWPAVSPRCPLHRRLDGFRFCRNSAQNTKSPFPLGNEPRFAGHITPRRSLGDLLTWQRSPCCWRREALSTEAWSLKSSSNSPPFSFRWHRSPSPSSIVHVSNTDKPLTYSMVTNYRVEQKSSENLHYNPQTLEMGAFHVTRRFLTGLKNGGPVFNKFSHSNISSPDYLTQGWPKTWYSRTVFATIGRLKIFSNAVWHNTQWRKMNAFFSVNWNFFIFNIKKLW